MCDKITTEKRLKELKFFRDEIFTNMMETLDLLDNLPELEAFLMLLPEDKRDKLYNHKLLEEYDILP